MLSFSGNNRIDSLLESIIDGSSGLVKLHGKADEVKEILIQADDAIYELIDFVDSTEDGELTLYSKTGEKL